MADDIEKAILISFSYTGSIDFQLKEQASAYINQIKNNPDVWRLCVERFETTGYSEVKFWCIQTLYEVIRKWYQKYDESTKAAIKTALLTWIQRDCAVKQSALPSFLKNKIAQTLVAIVQVEFPSVWPSFFHDLIGATQQGPGVVDMFCRILNSVDEDIISLDIPRSSEESRLSMHVKDAMREQSIGEVAAAWYQLVAQYHSQDPELAAMVLQTVQRYIHWIDIGLVANDKFATLIRSLMEAPTQLLRAAATDCLTEMLSKRMEATAKLSLIEGLGVVPLAAHWGDALAGVEDMEDLVSRYARLLSTLASEILDCLKRVENGMISIAAMGVEVDDDVSSEVKVVSEAAMKLLNQLFPAVLKAFRSGVDDVALPLLPFLLAYVGRLKTLSKRSSPLPADSAENIRTILQGVAIASRYPDSSPTLALHSPTRQGTPDPADVAAAREEQLDVEEKRRDLLTLFKNIARIAFPEALQFVTQLLQTVITNAQTPFQEVEVAVVLLYEIGEAAPEEAMKPGSGVLGQRALALMQAAVPAATHPAVALAVLEVHVRYAKVLQHAPAAIPAVVATFLDARGLGHPTEEVAVRAAYLFCRLVKALKQNLRPHLPSILTSIQTHLARIASTPLPDPPSGKGDHGHRAVSAPPAAPPPDDRLYVFEAVGLLLGQEEVEAGQQQQLLSSLLQPLLQQIEANLGGMSLGELGRGSAAALIVQAMEAVARLNKGFRIDLATRQRPQIGAMFVRALEVAVSSPRVYPTNKALRARFISLLHRLVEGLMSAVLPCLPAAVEALLGVQPDAADLCEVLALLNQLLVRFKDQLQQLLEALLPPVAARVHALLTADWDWSGRTAVPTRAAVENGNGVVATLEDAREKGELQRAYYSFLHSVVHNNLSSTLLRIPREALEAVMGGVTRGAATHVDPTVRRNCMQIFQRLLTEWCSNGGESVPGFKRYAMDTIGGEVCLMGLVRGGLDPRDAAVSSLLGEVASTLNSVYTACGDDFPSHLLAVVMPRCGVQPAVQQQLVGSLREGDLKALKECLRGLLPNAPGGKS